MNIHEGLKEVSRLSTSKKDHNAMFEEICKILSNLVWLKSCRDFTSNYH